MSVRSAQQAIHDVVTQWAGITSGPHRFGGTEWLLGKTEIGHIHGHYLVDIPLSRSVRDEVIAAGKAEPHHIYPMMGWVSVHLNDPEDVNRAIELLRLSYELVNQRLRRLAQHTKLDGVAK